MLPSLHIAKMVTSKEQTQAKTGMTSCINSMNELPPPAQITIRHDQ
jgi:hypothetical protein